MTPGDVIPVERRGNAGHPGHFHWRRSLLLSPAVQAPRPPSQAHPLGVGGLQGGRREPASAATAAVHCLSFNPSSPRHK